MIRKIFYIVLGLSMLSVAFVFSLAAIIVFVPFAVVSLIALVLMILGIHSIDQVTGVFNLKESYEKTKEFHGEKISYIINRGDKHAN